MEDLDRDDAEDVAGMLVATGRAVAPGRWVEYLIEAGKQAALEGLY